MEIDLNHLAAATAAQHRLLAAELLDHRARACAATGCLESTVAFIVPYDVLIGVTVVGGSPVIHSTEVRTPGIVLPLPEVPGS
jgi:hypothetical protein